MLLALASVLSVSTAYNQIHVALGKKTDELSVSWATANKGGESKVYWGLSENSLKESTTGDVREFSVDSGRIWYTRTAIMTGLETNTRYYYKVAVGSNYSNVYSVMNRDMSVPHKHILFGDLGAAAGFTVCTKCTQQSSVCTEEICTNTTVGLVSETDSADMFLHVGDFAYNLADDNGTLGDQFMNNIEQLAARVPYMVSHGNHEDSPQNLAHFVERFRGQPSNAVPSTFTTLNGETTNTLYFSWDHGLVHYVSFSTELWVGITDGKVNKTTFITWLKKDLKNANKKREEVPWILIHGHRPLYDSSGGDIFIVQDLEDILFENGVDFSINGHVHNYERSWPTYKNKSDQSYVNPKATIYVVTGAAGSREMHSPFSKPPPSFSAFRSNSFSYTRMMVYNYSHIHWQQVQTDPSQFPMSDYGRVIDDIWIVQNRHGAFNKSEAPKTTPTSCLHDNCEEYDHFMGLLNIGEGVNKPVWKAVQEYREKHGELAWGAKLKELLKIMNADMFEEESLDVGERKFFSWANEQSV